MSTWPRLYLLTLYQTAIEQGYCTVQNIDEPSAKSLTAAFYRLRRRSDTSNAQFITPQHHMVTVEPWAPDHTLRIVYSKPSHQLPPITGPDGQEINPFAADDILPTAEAFASDEAPTDLAEIISSPNPDNPEEPQRLSINNTEVIVPADLVASLRSSAAARKGKKND